jgi:hypothetical protein
MMLVQASDIGERNLASEYEHTSSGIKTELKKGVGEK